MPTEETKGSFPNFQYQQPPSPTPPPVSPTPYPTSSGSGAIIKIIVGIIVIGIIGTGVALATQIWDPLWNPFRANPEKVIEKMVVKMGELNATHSEMKVGIITEEDEKKVFDFSINYLGDSDATDSSNPKTAGLFEIGLAFEGTQFTITGEIRSIGENSYFRLTTLPAFLQEELPIDLNEVKDQWFKIYPEFIQEWSETMMGEAYPTEMQPMFQEMLKIQTELQKEIQKEIKERLKKLTSDKKFYSVKKELRDEKIEGTKVYHYLVVLNREEIKRLILEITEIYIDISYKKMFEVFPEEFRPSPEDIEYGKRTMIEAMEKGFNEILEKIGNIESEIWIGKKDFYLYRIRGEKEFEWEKEMYSYMFEPAAKEKIKEKITVKFDMNLSNFNKPVKIEPPERYKGLEEVLIPLIEAQLEESRQKAKDARIIADMNQIRVAAEIHLMNRRPESYTNFCTSSKATKLKKDIIEQGGTNYSCNVQRGAGAGKSYCVEVQLNSGNWWCVDSNLIMKQYGSNPICVSCIGKTCKCE